VSRSLMSSILAWVLAGSATALAADLRMVKLSFPGVRASTIAPAAFGIAVGPPQPAKNVQETLAEFERNALAALGDFKPIVTIDETRPGKPTVRIRFHSNVDKKLTDDDLIHLKVILHLQSLDMGSQRISDAGLEHLKGLTQLEELDLRWNKVTAEGVVRLVKRLPKLRRLGLAGPQEAGNGLAHITVSCSDWKEAVVPSLTFELPVIVLPKKHTAEAKGITSTSNKVETTISFVNTSKQTIKVYWLDYEGKRQLKETVKEGDSYESKKTFSTHPWLITDKDDNAWEVYFPDAQPRTVEIVGPRSTAQELKKPTPLEGHIASGLVRGEDAVLTEGAWREWRRYFRGDTYRTRDIQSAEEKGLKERASLKGKKGPVLALAITADGKILASGAGERTVTLWDMANAIANCADNATLISSSQRQLRVFYERC
jgi:hypothetical protein